MSPYLMHMMQPRVAFIKGSIWWTKSMTRRNREVVDFTRSRVKNNSKLTNLIKLTRIEGLTRRNREVVNFKRYRVKNNSKLTNFEN